MFRSVCVLLRSEGAFSFSRRVRFLGAEFVLNVLVGCYFDNGEGKTKALHTSAPPVWGNEGKPRVRLRERAFCQTRCRPLWWCWEALQPKNSTQWTVYASFDALCCNHRRHLRLEPWVVDLDSEYCGSCRGDQLTRHFDNKERPVIRLTIWQIINPRLGTEHNSSRHKGITKEIATGTIAVL